MHCGQRARRPFRASCMLRMLDTGHKAISPMMSSLNTCSVLHVDMARRPTLVRPSHVARHVAPRRHELPRARRPPPPQFAPPRASAVTPVAVDLDLYTRFVLVGKHRYIARRRATLVLRGVFFAQWRAQRNGTPHGQAQRTRRQVYEAMDKRLRAAILKDWVRRQGRDEFVRRWRPLQ